jgi:ATP-binding protein involved in chromosome partitioning
MMGLRRRADTSSITLSMRTGDRNSKLEPARRYGVQLSSAAFLMGENQALSVEASLAKLLVHRLLADTDWDNLDCLIVDLPPGTADIQQLVLGLGGRSVSVLAVVTPQVVAHQDVRRLIAARSRLRADIIGGVENMSDFVCPSCGDVTRLFPPAPASEAVWGLIPKLAAVPFSPEAAQDADEGNPVMVTKRVPQQVAAYEQLAGILRQRFDA